MNAVYIGEVEVHPAAQMFPEMSQDDLNSLYESIKRDGLQKPVVFHDGKLLDGRNRVRAGLMASIPIQKMPRINIREDEDPYKVAWALNCERLSYAPAEKAAIKKRIEEESGRLQTLRKEAEESRRAKVAASNAKRVDKPQRSGVRHVADTEAAPEEKKSDRRTNAVAAKLAAEAGVSQRTMERVMGKLKKGGSQRKRPQKMGETWRVPRDVRLLALFLRQNMPSDEVRKLARLLTEEKPIEATA